MKIFLYFNILILSVYSIREYSDAHYIKLNNDKCTIDGVEMISQYPILGANYKKGVVNIVEKGAYIISGELNGKLNIATEEGITKVILNGVTINSTINALTIEKGYELINTTIEDDPRILKNFDFTKAGVQIIIADDSINTLYGTEDGDQSAAVYSAITMHITGEEKGNGILNVISKYEGIEVYKHICISGGIIKVVSVDDGINTKISKDSVIYIKGGKVIVNAGVDDHEGDGIDGNGYILIDGGEVISSAHPRSDSGLDSNFGILIDGGRVYAIGCSMDMAEKESKQSTMNLIFKSSVLPNNTITIKDKSGKEIISFNAEKAEFIEGTQRKEYSAAIVSDPTFKKDDIYYIYMDGIQLGYTSNTKGGFWPGGPGGFGPGGFGPGGQGGPGGPGGQGGPGGKGGPGGPGGQGGPGGPGGQGGPGGPGGQGGPEGPGGQGGPGGPPPDETSKSEENEMKRDFVLGEGANYYSGIQKFVLSENSGKYLNLYSLLMLVLLYIF